MNWGETYAFGNVLAVYVFTGRYTWRRLDSGRINSQRLLNTCVQVFELRSGQHRDIPLGREGCPNLLLKPLKSRRVCRQVVSEARKRSSCRLAASHEEAFGVAQDLCMAHALLVVVTKDVRHKVVPTVGCWTKC